jgi:hypothetical protein
MNVQRVGFQIRHCDLAGSLKLIKDHNLKSLGGERVKIASQNPEWVTNSTLPQLPALPANSR